MTMLTRTLRALGASLVLTATGAAVAQDFPSRTVTLIVPYAPGGAVDATARALATELAKNLGQSVVVENKPGASGMLGMALLKRAKPDGHTIAIDTPAVAMNPSVHSKPLYTAEELRPVAQLMRMPYVAAMAPQVGNTYQDLVAQLRKRPGELNAASGVVITGDRRAPSLPDVPAAAVVDRLNQHVRQALKTPAMTAFIQARGGMPVDTSASEFASFYQAEVQRWRQVMQQAGIEPQ